jgi:predicted enzyme related to lactoylglutathione lyase
MSTPTSPVSGVDFISVPTRNYAAAAEFYGSVLGLRCSAEYERIPGGEFETGSLTLQVIDAEAIGREFHPHRFPIALHVEDIEAARAELERAASRSATTSTPASATWPSSKIRTATRSCSTTATPRAEATPERVTEDLA